MARRTKTFLRINYIEMLRVFNRLVFSFSVSLVLSYSLYLCVGIPKSTAVVDDLTPYMRYFVAKCVMRVTSLNWSLSVYFCRCFYLRFVLVCFYCTTRCSIKIYVQRGHTYKRPAMPGNARVEKQGSIGRRVRHKMRRRCFVY